MRGRVDTLLQREREIVVIIMTIGCVSGVQAWAILQRHAHDEIAPLRLQELCRDNDRVSSLVAVHNSTSVLHANTMPTSSHEPALEQDRMLLLDLSRQRMTTNTLNHLLQLAEARGLQRFVQLQAWGGQNNPRDPISPLRLSQKGNAAASNNPQRRTYNKLKNNHSNNFDDHPLRSASNNNKTTRFEGGDQERRAVGEYKNGKQQSADASNTNAENGGGGRDSSAKGIDSASPSSMHMALRVPKDQGYEMLLKDGSNALDGIHYEWNRLERLSNLIRRGSFRGVTGNMIQTCLVVGSGVPVKALQFVYHALLQDERAVLESRAGLENSNNIISSSANRLLSRPRNILLTAAAAATGNPAPPSVGSSSAQCPSRRLVFLSTMDPVAAAQTLQDLDAASTLVVSLGPRGNEETGMITSILKQWLLQELGGSNNSHASNTSSHGSGIHATPSSSSGSMSSSTSHHNSHGSRRPELIMSKHMMLVTGNERIAAAINRPESVHLIPQQCRVEAFTSFTSAALLPIGIVFGWSTAREFLSGAHDIDLHFVNNNPRHNLPVLLALTDIWNDILLGNNTARIITPFSQALSAYPGFCAALEAQTCGNTASSVHDSTGGPGGSTGVTSASPPSPSHNYGGFLDRRLGGPMPNSNKMGCSSIVVDGGFAAGAYDRSLYQSDAHIVNSELVMTLDLQLQFNALHCMNANSEHKNPGLAETICAT